MRRRTIAGVLAATVLTGLCACTPAGPTVRSAVPTPRSPAAATSSPSPAATSSASLSAPATSAAPTPRTTRVAAASATLPPGFPVPTGARLTQVVRGVDRLSATIELAGAATGTAAWTSSLAKAGYRVTGAHDDGGLGEVRFTGRGCRAGSQVVLTGRSAAVQCVLR